MKTSVKTNEGPRVAIAAKTPSTTPATPANIAAAASAPTPPPVTAKVTEQTPPANSPIKVSDRTDDGVAAASQTETESTAVVEETAGPSKAAKAAKQARQAASKNRQLLAEHERAVRDASYHAQQTESLQAQLRQTQEFIAGMQRDPVGTMRALGVSTEDIANRMVKDGSPEAKIAELEQKLANQEEYLRGMLRNGEREKQAARAQAEETTYKTQSRDVQKYPNLQAIPPDFILARTKEVILELKRRGQDPTRYSNHDLLEYLDAVYADQKPAAKAAAQAEKPKAETPKTKTITNRLAASKYTAPADFDKWDDRRQKKWMAEQLTKS